MFEPQSRAPARSPPSILSALQFLSIEVAPAGDGSLWVTSTGTYVDEARLEFFNDEIKHARVASLDDAVTTIRGIIVEALFTEASEEGH